MQYRFPAVAALALGIASLPLAAQDFRYTPGTARYEASVVTKMTREIGGQRMDDEITQSQLLTVGLTSTGGDTLRIGVTLDSASVTTRSGPQDVTPLVGLKVDGRISAVGDVYSSAIVGRDIGPTGTMVANELARFLPRMRRDLRTGLAWSDTTTEQLDMLGVPVERRIITNSTVTGDTTVAGARGWKIDRKSAVSFTGTGMVSGQQVRLAGTSNADGLIVLTRGGRFLGSTQTDSSTTNFVIPATGMQVAMKQSQVMRVQLVP